MIGGRGTTDDLTKARADHQTLVGIVVHQLKEGDPGPVERFALLAVQRLLADHVPTLHAGYDKVCCESCWDDDNAGYQDWPCDVFYTIERASLDGQ